MTTLKINQTNVPGAVIKLAGPTVRDLIDALEQLDPDTRTTVKQIQLIDGPRDWHTGMRHPANLIFSK